MLKIKKQALIKTKSDGIDSLYNKYGAMLLGYIFEIVKDQKLAEDFLVKVFCDLSYSLDELDWDKKSSWSQLQRFARKRLAAFTTIPEDEAIADRGSLVYSSRNKHFGQLNHEQQHVFYAMYYHGKSVAAISAELNKTEDLIRKILKEAFAILRKDAES